MVATTFKVARWPFPANMKDSSMQCFYQKGMVVVVMVALAAAQPKYTTSDLIVAVRDGVHEIITLRNFKPHEVFFAPETTDVKDVFWTQGRSHGVNNTAGVHPDNRHWILDGRLRANANTDNKDLVFSSRALGRQTPTKQI